MIYDKADNYLGLVSIVDSTPLTPKVEINVCSNLKLFNVVVNGKKVDQIEQ